MVNTMRLRWIAWALSAWVAVVVLRLLQIQVLDHKTWESGSARQREHPLEVPRGCRAVAS